MFTAESPDALTISVMPAEGGEAKAVGRGSHGAWQPDSDGVHGDASPTLGAG